MTWYTYIKGRKKIALVAGSAVFTGSGILASYGLFLILNIVSRLVSGVSMVGALPFTDTTADFFLAALYFLAAAVLLMAAYLLMETHYGGSIVATVFGVCLFSASMLGNVSKVFGLMVAISCFIGASLGLWQRRRNPIAKTQASIVEEKIAKNVLRLTSLVAVVALFFVAAVIFTRGSSYISLTFLTSGWPPRKWLGVVDIIEGRATGGFGCGPAIAGSLLVVGLCEAICVPLGLGSAIFLAEYAAQNFFTRIIRFFVELLAGVPSIILGIFGFTFFSVEFGWHQRSLLGGAICLAFMTLPWNIRVAEEAIKAVPREFKAASYALGATKLQTIRRVILESAAPGILTGTLLGFGAAFGEAAVVIFSAGDPFASWPTTTNLWTFLTGSDMPTLPAWIYGAFTGPRSPNYAFWPKEQNVAFAGAFVLVAIFLAVTITALLGRNHLSKKLAGA